MSLKRLGVNPHLVGLVMTADRIVDKKNEAIVMRVPKPRHDLACIIGAHIVENAEGAEAERVMMAQVLADDILLVLDEEDHAGAFERGHPSRSARLPAGRGASPVKMIESRPSGIMAGDLRARFGPQTLVFSADIVPSLADPAFLG